MGVAAEESRYGAWKGADQRRTEYADQIDPLAAKGFTVTPSARSNSPGWLLAIDASTEQAGIALLNGATSAECSWPAGRNQTSMMLGEIDRLARVAGCNVKTDLGCVAVATGPGMFNGLRVGMSIAKGLALAIGLDVIGAPTLMIAAHPFAVSSRPVVVVAAAGRKRLLWQHFAARSLVPASRPTNGLFDELIADLSNRSESTIVTGELSVEQWTAIEAIPSVIPAAPPAHVRRAGSLAAIGWRRWRAGDIDDAAALEPTYLHANAAPKDAAY